MSEKTIETLNKDLANLHVFWVKLHNYHWHIRGPHFFTLHEQTEAYYNYVGEFYDDVAERILQLGGKPMASAQEYLDNATIKEESKKDFTPDELLVGCREGFETLLSGARAVLEIAEECDDIATANLYEDHVEKTGKYIWMLRQAAS